MKHHQKVSAPPARDGLDNVWSGHVVGLDIRRELADNLFQDILQRNQSLDSPVFINHKAQALFCPLKIQQLRVQGCD